MVNHQSREMSESDEDAGPVPGGDLFEQIAKLETQEIEKKLGIS